LLHHTTPKEVDRVEHGQVEAGLSDALANGAAESTALQPQQAHGRSLVDLGLRHGHRGVRAAVVDQQHFEIGQTSGPQGLEAGDKRVECGDQLILFAVDREDERKACAQSHSSG
jgi:hypothetical protein